MSLRKPPPNDAQLELFSAIFTDIASRDAQDVMEFPFLSLSKKPRYKPIEYVSPSGVKAIVSGGEPFGIANIWDYDLIVWLLSQLRQALDSGSEVSRKMRFSRHAYLKTVRRHTSGDEYKRLNATVLRLKATTISTNIRSKKHGETEAFSWFEHAKIDYDENGVFIAATVTLPEWLYEAVCDHRLVLSLHNDYFLLKKGYEKWLYRLFRKSAGNGKKGWEWKYHTLHERSGTTRPYKAFAADIRDIAKKGKLLDYTLSNRTKNNEPFLHAVKTSTQSLSVEAAPIRRKSEAQFLRVSGGAIEKAKAASPGWDVYALYEMWKEYNAKKKEVVQYPDSAFISFCKKHAELNPLPAR